MQLDPFGSFRDTADINGVLFYYNGALSQNVIATMGDTLRLRLDSADTKGSTARKLFSSFIELAQNALNYSPENPEAEGEKVGAIAVGRNGDRYFIVSGNLVQKQYEFRIREKIDALRSMSTAEIKDAYRAQLRSDDADSDSKGAGLGLLTVARDAVEPIEYSLSDIPGYEDRLSYFYLKATV